MLFRSIGFRSAHEVSSRFARSGNDIAVLRKAYLEVVGAPLPLDDARIQAILEPAYFVEIRRTPGGPSKEGMLSVLEELAESIDNVGNKLTAIGNGITVAEAELGKAWKALTA